MGCQLLRRDRVLVDGAGRRGVPAVSGRHDVVTAGAVRTELGSAPFVQRLDRSWDRLSPLPGLDGGEKVLFYLVAVSAGRTVAGCSCMAIISNLRITDA